MNHRDTEDTEKYRGEKNTVFSVFSSVFSASLWFTTVSD